MLIPPALPAQIVNKEMSEEIIAVIVTRISPIFAFTVHEFYVAVRNRAGLAAEGGDTKASIFFSLVTHRMNINYSFQVSKREAILTRPLPARGVSCSWDFRAGGWRGRVSGACSLQGPWGLYE